MTIPNTFLNGTTADADEVNANLAYVNNVWDVESITRADAQTGIIAHSTTNYSVVEHNNGEIRLWNGTTLVLKNTSFGAFALIRLCKADPTHGFAVEGEITGSAKTAFTDDSGATWGDGTAVGHSTGVYDASFPTAALIVVAGDDAGADFIQYSTDDAATWNDATTSPSALVYCVDMFSATVGYCVDSAGNIWKTTDGADTWVDTTDGIGVAAVGSSMSILCLDADTCIIAGVVGSLYHYDNSTNTVTLKNYNGLLDKTGGIVNTNGYVYVNYFDASNGNGQLFKSSDSGVTWDVTPFFSPGETEYVIKCSFTSYDTGKVMYVTGGSIYKQDRSNL
jgi:photosystem II stability/assembly factor-like uncharacterized protein